MEETKIGACEFLRPKACLHCTTDLVLTSSNTSALHRQSTETTSGGGFEPVWAHYAHACTPPRDFKLRLLCVRVHISTYSMAL